MVNPPAPTAASGVVKMVEALRDVDDTPLTLEERDHIANYIESVADMIDDMVARCGAQDDA